MFNTVILVGNLTRDPEMRYLPTGTPVLKFGIATNRKYGEKKETFFGEVNVWGKMAEVCEKYLHKGSKVLIDGRLSTESWESDGKKKSKTVITAKEVKFLDSRQSDRDTDEIPEEQTELEPF